MSTDTVSPQEILTVLSQAPEGMSLGELLTHFGGGDRVNRGLEAAVMSRQAGLRFDPLAPKACERFTAETQPEAFVASNSDRSKVLDAVLGHIGQQYDNRGDPQESSTLGKMQADLGTRFGSAAISQAVLDGIGEGLLTMRSHSSNQYVWFSVSRKTHFTVLALDGDAHQPLCFHVRAGNEQVAVAKVQASGYSGDELCIHGICPGIVKFANVPGHSGYLVEAL